MTSQQIQDNLKLAEQHRQAARFADAEVLYRQILAADPDQPDSLHWLGFVLFTTGRPAEAAEVIRRAIAAQPTCADHYGNLSVVLAALGKFDDSIAAARQLVALRANSGEGYDILAHALRRAGRLDQAIAAYRQGIAAAPAYAAAYVHLAEALFDKGQKHESMATYRQALVVQPNYPEAWFGLAIAFKAQWQLDECIAAYEKAIALRPNYADAHMNLANIQLIVGELEEACESSRRSMAADPGEGHAHSNLILDLHYRHDISPREIAAELQSWNRIYAEPLGKFIQPHDNDRSPDRPLRIGYISCDFRNHPVGRFLLPLLTHHDRRQFQIYCYSDTKNPDKVTGRIRQCADVWKNSIDLKPAELAQAVRDDRIDILVDLSLHTNKHRLLVFARKPAPVQVSHLGYCGSTGLKTIDYRITDPYFDPPGCDESGYSEKSIRLPKTYWVYEPVDSTPAVGPLPALQAGFITFGCQNNYCKITPDVWTAWIAILRATPNSKLLVYTHQGKHREKARRRFFDAGIDPDRLIFSDSTGPAYFHRYQQIDIGLDPFPFNGGTTTTDAIWMGVPVVTLRGPMAVGRAGASILTNVGIPQFIAATSEEYVQLAVQTAADLPALSTLRASLRQMMRQSPLMDAKQYAADVEAVFRRIWRQWCQETP